MNLNHSLASVALVAMMVVAGRCQEQPAITFNQNFEGGSLGKIEKLGDTTFRCYVRGQHDERGRNRQANWYYFRMNHVKRRDVTLTFTDVVGEYNDQPGACPLSADTIPVFSYDDEHWQHFPSMAWDDQKKAATLQFHSNQETFWIAHIPPYPHWRLNHLLGEIGRSAAVRIEVIGKTVQGRDLHLVTATQFDRPDGGKQTVWLQARQHAWEAGTSWVMEGALRFIASEDPRARALRDRVIFKFTPMMDPDGCANGQVRFNANGYDLNRHWDKVDLRRKEFLERMPEIWYVKKAILGHVDSGRSIGLMINLHNTESSEFMDTQADDEASQRRMQRLDDRLADNTTFDPSRKLAISKTPGNTTNFLYDERRIPVLLMEQRIGFSKKLGRRPTVEDRLSFGKQLITELAETVLESN